MERNVLSTKAKITIGIVAMGFVFVVVQLLVRGITMADNQKQAVNAVTAAVASLYNDHEKQRLSRTLTLERLEEVEEQLSALEKTPLEGELALQYEDAQSDGAMARIMFEVQESVTGLLDDQQILADEVTEETLSEITEKLTHIQDKNEFLADMEYTLQIASEQVAVITACTERVEELVGVSGTPKSGVTTADLKNAKITVLEILRPAEREQLTQKLDKALEDLLAEEQRQAQSASSSWENTATVSSAGSAGGGASQSTTPPPSSPSQQARSTAPSYPTSPSSERTVTASRKTAESVAQEVIAYGKGIGLTYDSTLKQTSNGNLTQKQSSTTDWKSFLDALKKTSKTASFSVRVEPSTNKDGFWIYFFYQN